MQFVGSGHPASDEGFEFARSLLDVDAATLWTVLTVETAGFGFLPSRRPSILFERHVFHRLTGGRFDEANPLVSSPIAGGYAGGASEYLRLNGAAMLDADAALQSTSWGIGQVIGCHFAELGFSSVQQMVEAMVRDEDDQLAAMARFIDDEGIVAALRARKWRTFARWYNGRGFARHQYDVKLAAAFTRLQAALPDLDVRGAQAALRYLGFSPGVIDGILGPRTRAAVVAFQRKRRMAMTGNLDELTMEVLMEGAFGV